MSGGRDATMPRQDAPTQETRKRMTRRAGSLAREDFSRKSMSYAATALAAAVFGLMALPAFSSAVIPQYESARSEGIFTDFFFLAILSVLSINTISSAYTFVHRDPFSAWLLFQRTLPVSSREIVLGRALVMLPTTFILTALFFAPVVFFSWWLDYEFDAAQYLWFWIFWLGYALFAGGINLYMELGVRGKLMAIFQPVWMGIIVALAWLFGGNIVWTTFELSGSYGPLPAGLALLAGGLLFGLLARVTEWRVQTREMSP